MLYDNEITDILSVTQVAEILHSGKNVVYDLLRSGQLKGFRVNEKGNYRIPKAALRDYIKKQTNL